jgi:hypothetical protein
MKSIQTLLTIAAATCSVSDAFTHVPSSFTGSASSVCSRAELNTELQCPPASSSFNKHRGRNLGMPPFLKKLGLKKPENPIFGGGEESNSNSNSNAAVSVEVETKEEEEKELSQSEKLLKQVKESGKAGILSYALWELAFWAISVPVCVFGYYELVGHMPDFSSPEDLSKLGGEAFAFVNFARLAVPLRIGLAISTTPWIQDNIMDKYFSNDDDEEAN